jgi:hypothetical protein
MLPATRPERLPQTLAEQLDGLMRVHEHDTEVCRTLRIAREQLRVLSWNRFAARHEHADKAFRLRRRHQGHSRSMLWRGLHGNPQRSPTRHSSPCAQL